jgi:hypothetical protein
MGNAGAAAAEKRPPSGRRVVKWQSLRVCERDPERIEELRLQAMEEPAFRKARKRKRNQLRRLHLDELHDVPKRRPPAGAIAVVEYLAMLVAYWGYEAGLMVPAKVLAPHVGCSRWQVPIAIAWAERRALLSVVEVFEPHPEGFETRTGEHVKNPQIANLLMPGPALLDMLERRRVKIENKRALRAPRGRVRVGVQGSENFRSDALSFSLVSKEQRQEKKNNNPRARGQTALVDNTRPFADWDDTARAEEDQARKERAQKRARNRSPKSTEDGGPRGGEVAAVSAELLKIASSASSSSVETPEAEAPPRPTLETSAAPEATETATADPTAAACLAFMYKLVGRGVTADEKARADQSLAALAELVEPAPELPSSSTTRRATAAAPRRQETQGARRTDWRHVRPHRNAPTIEPEPYSCPMTAAEERRREWERRGRYSKNAAPSSIAGVVLPFDPEAAELAREERAAEDGDPVEPDELNEDGLPMSWFRAPAERPRPRPFLAAPVRLGEACGELVETLDGDAPQPRTSSPPARPVERPAPPASRAKLLNHNSPPPPLDPAPGHDRACRCVTCYEHRNRQLAELDEKAKRRPD